MIKLSWKIWLLIIILIASIILTITVINMVFQLSQRNVFKEHFVTILQQGDETKTSDKKSLVRFW